MQNTSNLDVIPVYLPDEDAKQFLVFQQYYEPINLLLNAKVFEQRNATVLLDFDKFGVLSAIRRNDVLYRSGMKPQTELRREQ